MYVLYLLKLIRQKDNPIPQKYSFTPLLNLFGFDEIVFRFFSVDFSI